MPDYIVTLTCPSGPPILFPSHSARNPQEALEDARDEAPPGYVPAMVEIMEDWQ